MNESLVSYRHQTPSYHDLLIDPILKWMLNFSIAFSRASVRLMVFSLLAAKIVHLIQTLSLCLNHIAKKKCQNIYIFNVLNRNEYSLVLIAFELTLSLSHRSMIHWTIQMILLLVFRLVFVSVDDLVELAVFLVKILFLLSLPP